MGEAMVWLLGLEGDGEEGWCVGGLELTRGLGW